MRPRSSALVRGSPVSLGVWTIELLCSGPRPLADPGTAFVREPEGNGVAERFIRTLKEQLLWVWTFDTVEELRQALFEFKGFYVFTSIQRLESRTVYGLSHVVRRSGPRRIR
jgi:hypothetical protein